LDPFESIKATFFQECDELLTELESGLLAMEQGATDPETINAVFRAVHSIKGGAGAFGLEELIRFAHVFETAMDEIRAGRIALDDDIAKLLLRANDVLADLVQAAQTDGSVDPARTAAMLDELQALIGAEAAAALDAPLDEDEDDFGFTPVQMQMDEPSAPKTRWLIEFQPKTEMYAKANEAGLVLRELARLGEVEIALDEADVPPLDQMMAEHAYLRWTITLATDADEAAIREIFEFVEDDCVLTLNRLDDMEEEPPAQPSDEPFDPTALLSRLTAEVPAAEPAEAAPEPAAPEPAPEIPQGQMGVAGLIALATHGAGGLERLMVGSVADKVIRGATTPVLIVRPARG